MALLQTLPQMVFASLVQLDSTVAQTNLPVRDARMVTRPQPVRPEALEHALLAHKAPSLALLPRVYASIATQASAPVQQLAPAADALLVSTLTPSQAMSA